jgi:protein TonB
MLVWCLAFILAMSAAQTETEEKVYDLGPGITPPRVIRQVNPEYSGERGVRVTGTVTVALIVTSRGLPKDPHVVKGLDKDMDESTIAAVKQWRFDPAKKDGKAVAVNITLEIKFDSR